MTDISTQAESGAIITGEENEKFILMEGHGGTARVTVAAYNLVWRHRGFKVKSLNPDYDNSDAGLEQRSDADVTAAEHADELAEASAFNVSKASKAELVAEAERLGLEADGTATELRDRISATMTPEV